MKNKIFISTLIVWGLLCFSCGKDKKEPLIPTEKKTETAKTAEIDINATNSKTIVVFTDTTMNRIYVNYLLVKKGLVNSNNDQARKAAKKLEVSIPKKEDYKQLRATANLIALTRGLKKQRDFFKTLTEEMEQLIGNATITSGEIYKQYCPMAFDDEGGYWLSDSQEVRNPYFGDRMLKCGNVSETIE